MALTRAELLTAAAGAALGAALAAPTHKTLDIATAALLGAALGGGRRFPRATWMLAAVLILASAARGELPGADPLAAYLLIAAHCLSAGRWDGHWRGVGGLAALTVASGLAIYGAGESNPFFLFTAVAAWTAGRVLRDRELLAAKLSERARELDQERDAHAELSVRYERARIASELHDIVAHAISVMVVQATAGQRLAAHDPELTAETFANLSSAARQAEADLGRLVALLGDENAIGEAPDLSLVEELVGHAAGSGLNVAVCLEGEREGLPTAVTEAAYRVVQEGLTNALRYAAGSAVSIVVRAADDTLSVCVENEPATGERALAGAGTGSGLRGLRERVGACAGKLEAGPTSSGGWRVSARLPLRATTASTPTD